MVVFVKTETSYIWEHYPENNFDFTRN